MQKKLKALSRLLFLQKSLIVDTRLGSEYASVWVSQKFFIHGVNVQLMYIIAKIP